MVALVTQSTDVVQRARIYYIHFLMLCAAQFFSAYLPELYAFVAMSEIKTGDVACCMTVTRRIAATVPGFEYFHKNSSIRDRCKQTVYRYIGITEGPIWLGHVDSCFSSMFADDARTNQMACAQLCML